MFFNHGGEFSKILGSQKRREMMAWICSYWIQRTYLKEGSMYFITGFDNVSGYVITRDAWSCRLTLNFQVFALYFNKETNAGESHFYKLVSSDTGHASAAPLLRGYAKVEPLTIAELK
ncbi:hypothetical protein IGI04_022974 [Brassica rapa subsp. trilocularis]|uniref:Uncharacterized protein n=1 Tax=Brassica rapa subsp. trilocularis TaxID=1813537 RepID=A0ABQ7M4W3_BRACM|nr:hypothetical protein IGI04_022974 [Brassica rapa subsp. trilocularis]